MKDLTPELKEAFENQTYPIRYYRWLVRVRQILSELNIKAIDKDGKPYRKYLFNTRVKLCPKSWYGYYESKLLPHQAVREDLELPWVEYKKQTTLH